MLDYLRTAYTTDFKVATSTGDETIKIRWFRCPRDWPVYTGQSLYTSNTWQEFPWADGYGEVGHRTWYNGKPPPVIQRANAHSDCVATIIEEQYCLLTEDGDEIAKEDNTGCVAREH